MTNVNNYYSVINSIRPLPRNENSDIHDIVPALDDYIQHPYYYSPITEDYIQMGPRSNPFVEKLEAARKKAIEWLFSDNTGISSMCLAGALLGVRPFRIDIPHDPADFRRCVNFLDMFHDDEILEYIWEEVANYSERWDRLSWEWDRLYRIYKRDELRGHSPELYEQLQLIWNPPAA